MALDQFKKPVDALDAEELHHPALSGFEFLLKLFFLPVLCSVPSCLAHVPTVAHG
jgi:hypothetical protein